MKMSMCEEYVMKIIEVITTHGKSITPCNMKQKCYFIRTVELLIYLTEHKAAYVKDILTGEIFNVNASRLNIDNDQLFITEEVLV